MTARRGRRAAGKLTPDQCRAVEQARETLDALDAGETAFATFANLPEYTSAYAAGWLTAELRRLLGVVDDLTGGER